MKSPAVVCLGPLQTVESPWVCRGWRHVSCEGAAIIQMHNDSLFILKFAWRGGGEHTELSTSVQKRMVFKLQVLRARNKENAQVKREADRSGCISWSESRKYIIKHHHLLDASISSLQKDPEAPTANYLVRQASAFTDLTLLMQLLAGQGLWTFLALRWKIFSMF